jgi:hypothetical protein
VTTLGRPSHRARSGHGQIRSLVSDPVIRMPAFRVRMRRLVPSSRLATIGRVPAAFTAARDCPGTARRVTLVCMSLGPGQDDPVRISHRGLARDLGWLPEGDDDDAKQ